jgi:hypothetical protein
MIMLSASDLAGRLAQNAEAVCRHYLSAGVRAGNFWIAGDVMRTARAVPFMSISLGHAVGKWMDAATGEYGDLLDLVRETCGLVDFRDIANEARHFPQSASGSIYGSRHTSKWPATGQQTVRTTERASRLFAISQPLYGTSADLYLRRRGILRASTHAALRFHPSCYYRDFVTGGMSAYPALIAAVTDGIGTVTGDSSYLARS